MFEFNWPWVFVLLPLPLLVWYLFPAASEKRQAALTVPFIEDFTTLADVAEGRQSGRLFSAFLLALSWLLLVTATARPQWVGEALELPVSGRDLMMAVDLSGSMEIEDFRINGKAVDRLTATKYVAGDFIQQRQGDRMGLILFGSNAYLQTPLTFDLTTVNKLLMESVIRMAGKFTAIGDAIGLAIKRLKDNEQSSKVLILLTDGANTAGEVAPLKAAELAANYGIKIYTIGIGPNEMIRDPRRTNQSVDLDEKTLISIAKQTGGQYFHGSNTEGLSEIYKKLDELEPVEVGSQTIRPIKALFMWPLAMALLISGGMVFYRGGIK